MAKFYLMKFFALIVANTVVLSDSFADDHRTAQDGLRNLAESFEKGGDDARVSLTKTKLDAAMQEIDLYVLKHGRLPSISEFPSLGGADLTDAWGNPFEYEPATDGKKYTILAVGSDGKKGGTGPAGDLRVTK